MASDPDTQDDPAAELTALVSKLRHDLRGIITPAVLLASRLAEHSDPAVQKYAERISTALWRVNERLKDTYAFAPARGDRADGPVEPASTTARSSAAVSQSSGSGGA